MAGVVVQDQTNVGNIRDVDWVAKSFLLGGERIEKNAELKRWRKFSTADTKFVGSGIGEHTVINPSPQFTPMADIPRQGLWVRKGEPLFTPGDKENVFFGLGRGYSEGIDDHLQVVHMRFGVVHYKGLITFFTSFYDAEAANLARYGRASISYYAGLIAGTIATLPLAPLILVGKAWRFFTGRSSSKFADFKQTMPLFWTRMQVIYNILGANLGVIARTWENEGVYGNGADKFDDLTDKSKDSAYRRYMHRLIPDLFKEDGRLDIFTVANAASKRSVKYQAMIEKIVGSANSMTAMREQILNLIDKTTVVGENSIGIEEYLKKYHESVYGSVAEMNLDVDGMEDETSKAINAVASGEDPDALTRLGQAASQSGTDGNAQNSGAIGNDQAADQSAVTNLTNQSNYMAGIEGMGMGGSGGTGASKTGGATGSGTTNEVDANGNPISPKVTVEGSSTALTSSGYSRENEMKDVIVSRDKNSEGKSVVERIDGWFSRFAEQAVSEWNQGAAFLNVAVNYTGSSSISLSNSLKQTTIQTLFNGTSATSRDTRISLADYKTGFDFIDAGTKMIGGFVSGAADGLRLSGLMALAGNAFVDIPQQWDNSDVTFPTASFEIEVRTANPGNPLSAYLNLYPVVAALLAGAMPQSTGPQSYTSPFVCECYCQGLVAIRLGMMTELTITAAPGNLGYTKDRRPLAFNISFTVADMSSMMHMGVSNGFNVGSPLKRTLDDDSAFLDYLSTITGLHMRDMTNPHRKLALRVAARMQDYKAWMSPEHMASRIFGRDGILGLNKMFGATNWPGV